MRHNDDAFTTMLLTLPLTANKEELARPLSPAEFHRLNAMVKETGAKRLGALINMDISGLMQAFSFNEQEAYRVCMLLSRTMPLSYALERYLERGVDLLTLYDGAYPERLSLRLGENAPATAYLCGDEAILKSPAVAILGISGVKIDADTEAAVRALVRDAVSAGYAIATASEPGATRVAEDEVSICGGKLISVLGGDLSSRVREEGFAELIARRRAVALSLVHPDAPYTLAHAVARNRVVFALAQAAFIATSDARRGEIEALKNRYCDWIYVLNINGLEGNRALIARGAAKIADVTRMPFNVYARNWRMAQAEQLTFL